MKYQTSYRLEKATGAARAITSSESRWTTVVWALIGLITIGSIAVALVELASSLS